MKKKQEERIRNIYEKATVAARVKEGDKEGSIEDFKICVIEESMERKQKKCIKV